MGHAITRRASLDWTGEGTGPYVISGTAYLFSSITFLYVVSAMSGKYWR